MNIDSIKNGYVLDHIKAGKAMEIYEQLGLDNLDCQVALINNAKYITTFNNAIHNPESSIAVLTTSGELYVATSVNNYKIDFNNIQGELPKSTINNLVVIIKRCILHFGDSDEYNMQDECFRLMKYSMLRHYIMKLTNAVKPILKIEIPAKQRFNFQLMIQYKNITKYYLIQYNGFKEITSAEYEKSKAEDVNTDEVLEIIPLTEMEF